jgi:hypothetical protein
METSMAEDLKYGEMEVCAECPFHHKQEPFMSGSEVRERLGISPESLGKARERGLKFQAWGRGYMYKWSWVEEFFGGEERRRVEENLPRLRAHSAEIRKRSKGRPKKK